ncbi:TPA: hypothetical protein DCZ36_02405 [Candidatus Gracilibacteria bacterium]|nr:hypothetical protein [Candidatus Gracilibacteria bacterium]
MSVEGIKETKQAERVKIRFLRALNLPIDTLGEGETTSVSIVSETVEEVREKTEQALTAPHLEEERTHTITRAIINTIHLNAASVIKLNEKGLSPGERKFLIQISEWNLIGKVIGDKALEIIRKRVIEYIGDFPQENIDSIKKEYKGITADSLCSVAKRKKMSFDFHSFSPEAIEVLSPEVREFMFKISRSRVGFLGKTFNPEMITEEQDLVLRTNHPIKKRIFPNLRKFST